MENEETLRLAILTDPDTEVDRIEDELDDLTARLPKFTVLAAKGLGSWEVEKWTYKRKIKNLEIFHPDKGNKEPEEERNEEMLRSADALIVFTEGRFWLIKDALQRAKRHKLKVDVVDL